MRPANALILFVAALTGWLPNAVQASDAEFERFHRLNDAYMSRFGFPFVIAVRGHTRQTILANFETRLENDETAELSEALRNIGLIARFRLEDLLAR